MKHLYSKVSSDYIIDLNREEVKSEVQRSGMLVVIFSMVLLLITANLIFFIDESLIKLYGGPQAFVPSISALIVFLFYQVGVLYYLTRKLKTERKTSLLFKIVHSTAEVTFPSFIMVYYIDRLHMLSFVDSPVPLTYFLFIILSILHLDYRVSFLTGALAAVQYSLIVYYGFHHAVVREDFLTSTPENSQYLRAFFYLFCGGAAAFVSVMLQGRLKATFESQQEKNELQSLFGQYLSKEVSRALIEEKGIRKKTEATVMFLDIRNFTSFADTHSADEVIEFQNRFLAPVIETINMYQGVVFQILGDGLMACFGSPVENVLHADVAFHASIEILKKVKTLGDNGVIPQTRIGIGLHSGELIAGNIGNEQRKQFSISGTPVIIASRLEQLNKKYGTQFLISDDVLSRISVGKTKVSFVAQEPLKGFEKPVNIYSVAD